MPKATISRVSQERPEKDENYKKGGKEGDKSRERVGHSTKERVKRNEGQANAT